MNTKHGFRLLGITVLIIVIILGDPLSRQATAQGNVNLRRARSVE